MGNVNSTPPPKSIPPSPPKQTPDKSTVHKISTFFKKLLQQKAAKQDLKINSRHFERLSIIGKLTRSIQSLFQKIVKMSSVNPRNIDHGLDTFESLEYELDTLKDKLEKISLRKSSQTLDIVDDAIKNYEKDYVSPTTQERIAILKNKSSALREVIQKRNESI